MNLTHTPACFKGLKESEITSLLECLNAAERSFHKKEK